MDERTIFERALDLTDPEQRAAFLENACDQNSALRSRVEALLHSHEQAGSFLKGLPVDDAATYVPIVTAQPGETIGPYKILQQIGEGGMGIVYMAEQTEPVERRVALKIIKPGMDTRHVISRFEAEKQALSLMDHVNIARVLDAGTTQQGRPYFVMELIRGVPITKYCDDNHLTPRERLELFVPVCQAIQHAHQKGIIHRDVKPSNVLVTLYDGKPVPKVIDFGVAKATEQKLTEPTMFTQFGTLIGTLEYMSPEQAEFSALGVDTRSDVYSLGVLLYELLTGNTPLTHKRMKEAAYAEILRWIKEEEPPRPSARLSDPGEGLASISANRHTEPAKLSKLLRGELDWIVMKCLEKDRNRRYDTANGFAADVLRYLADEAVQACPPSTIYRFRKFARRNKRALATIAVLILAFLAVSGTLGWAIRDREAHKQEADKQRAARQTAVEHEVNLALNEAEQWQEQAKWPEALSAAKRAEGLLAGGGSDELRERVHLLRKDVEMVLRLESIHLLSSTLKGLEFDHTSADRAYRQAFADFGIDVLELPVEKLAAHIRARSGVAIPLVVALDDWAATCSAIDQSYRPELTSLAQAADSDPWRRRVRQAVQQKDRKTLEALATSPDLLRQPPTSLLLLARAIRSRDTSESQVQVLRQAQGQYPDNFWINYDLGTALHRFDPQYLDDAIAFLRAALAVRPESEAAWYNLGGALQDQGRLDEAITCYEKVTNLNSTYAFGYTAIGGALQEQKKFREAIAACHKAIELDPNDYHAYNNLAGSLIHQQRLPEALAALHKAIQLNPKHPFAYANLGGILNDQGKPEEAIAAYYKAIECNPKIAGIQLALGNLLTDQGKHDEAVTVYRQAIELDPTNARLHANCGLTLIKRGKLDEAIACYRKAIELEPKFADAHSNLANALCEQGKPDEAITCCQKAIELEPKHRNAHICLGNALLNQKKLADAVAAYRKAVEFDPKHANAYYGLGVALKPQGVIDEGILCLHKAIELDPKHANAHAVLGNIFSGQKKLDEAITCYRKAIELDPESEYATSGLGNALGEKGWELANSPDLKLRNPKRAIEVGKEAVELAPRLIRAWGYLGCIHYRAGNWEASIDAMKKSCELENGGDGGQWIVMSLAHAKLANEKALPEQERTQHQAEARRLYGLAVKQIDGWSPGDSMTQAIRAFREEARELLEVKE